MELTVALHYVFDIAKDKDRIAFDVSHQAYVHKILTGRRDRFPTLRKTDGLCGFTSQYESPYDLFHVWHAGTAVCSALGYGRGRKHAGQEPDPVTGAVMQPVYLTSTYRQKSLVADRGGDLVFQFRDFTFQYLF